MALFPSQPCQATGAGKCPATGQKRLMRTALFFQLWPDPSPVPSDRDSKCQPMMCSVDEVTMRFTDGYCPFANRETHPVHFDLELDAEAVKTQSGCDEVAAQLEFLEWTEAGRLA